MASQFHSSSASPWMSRADRRRRCRAAASTASAARPTRWTPLAPALRASPARPPRPAGLGPLAPRRRRAVDRRASSQAALRALARCRRRARACRRPFDGHDRRRPSRAREHPAGAQPRAVRPAARAARRGARRPSRARGAKARSEGVAGMQAIADALVQAATSAETKAQRPAAVAFVRESLMRQPPDGYARTCDALADAQAADASRISCPDAAGDRRRGRASRRRSRCAQMGEQDRRRQRQVEVLRGCGHWTPLEMPDECTRAPAPLLRAARHGSREEDKRMANVAVHQRAHHRRQRRAALSRARCWSRATASRAWRAAARAPAPATGVTVIDAAGATLMPGMVEAHTHFSLERRGDALDAIQRMPLEEHVLWSANVAKRYLESGLHLVRRRRLRQAAARRRHPQRDQRGADPGPALPRGEPGDHRGRRPRRRDAAAHAVAGVQLRRRSSAGPRRCARRCACSSSTASTRSSSTCPATTSCRRAAPTRRG